MQPDTDVNAAEYVRTRGMGAAGDYLVEELGLRNQHRTLYELSTDMLILERVLIDSEGVLDEELSAAVSAWMDAMADERERLLDDCVKLYRELTGHAGARKAEAKRLSELADTDERAAASLREQVRQFMERTDIRGVVRVPHGNLSLRANGGRQPLDWRITADEYAQLPEPLRETHYVPNQDAVRRAINAAVEARNARIATMQMDVNGATSKILDDAAWVIARQTPTSGQEQSMARTMLAGPYSDEAWETFTPEIRELVNQHYPPSEAESVLDLVGLKPRGNHVRIE